MQEVLITSFCRIHEWWTLERLCKMCGRLTENEVAVAAVVWTDVRALPVIRVIPARKEIYVHIHALLHLYTV